MSAAPAAAPAAAAPFTVESLGCAVPEAVAARCLSIYAPYVRDTPVSFELEVPALAAFRARLEGIARTHPFLVARGGDDEVIAYAYASPHRPARPAYRFSVEASVYVARAAQGRGVGTALYRALIDECKRRGFHKIYAGIALPNPASSALHARFGFEEAARFGRAGWKLGKWWDVVWLTLDLIEGDGPPAAGTPVLKDANCVK